MAQHVVGRRQFSAGLAVAALTGMPSARGQVAEGTSIILGHSGALSGIYAGVTQLQVDGARLAFEQANNESSGRLGRRKIELNSLDDGYNVQRSAENTRRLINSDVFALFGHGGTATSIASMQLAVQEGVPFFSPFTGAQELRQPFNRLVFHVRPSYTQEVALMVRQIVHTGIKRLGVVHRGDAYGRTVQEAVTTALAEEGLTLAGDAVLQEDTPAALQAAARTLLDAQCQAIFQANAPALCAHFVQEARKAGFNGVFYHLSVVGAETLADMLKKEARGLVVSQVVPSPYRASKPLARAFLQAIEKYGQGRMKPNYLSMEAYFSARVFIQGLHNAYAQSGGKLTREALVLGLESIQRRIDDVPIAFSRSNHQGSRFVEMSMLTGDGRVQV